MAGCLQPEQSEIQPVSRVLNVEIGEPRTIDGLGAAQGVEFRDGLVYLYGDREVGIIREYKVTDVPGLEYTGRELQLTVEGEDEVAHPTGLTQNVVFGTFLGDTVSGRGRIYTLDWEALLADGSLDNAIVNITEDDLAVNGTRPEFVRAGEEWVIATADYGDQNNAVRIYDPEQLRAASSTSEPGVLLAEFRCSPWVQSLHWIDERGVLALVQNQVEGLLWRITFVDLARSLESGREAVVEVIDLAPEDELEGFHLVNPNLAILVSSSRRDNLYLATLNWKQTF
ncbi:MAG: hypothetical protein JSU96_19550 [Acidobacteriota bacterium]|nr:MAG: hypothetical protein JSU96_19550 [Acidobacteriota bacterium]